MSVKTMEEIALFLKDMRFRKKFIGGVSEADVWRQLNDLHKEYQAAFDVQEECSRILIKEKEQEILRLKKQITKLRTNRGELNV